MRKSTSRAIAAGVIGSTALLVAAPAMAALASYGTGFEDVTIAKSNDRAAWRMTGGYDADVVTGATGDAALRISNAVTSGSFGDQLFSPSLAIPATENGPATTFDATFTLEPVDYQPGLRVTVSPDNGEGGRGGFLAIEHHADGMKLVSAGSYIDANGDLAWDYKTVASGLSYNEAHKVQLKLVKKPTTKKSSNNDVFSVKVDGKPVKNTTFEAYYQATGEPNYATDTLLFRVSGTAVPSLLGDGLRIDDLSMSTS